MKRPLKFGTWVGASILVVIAGFSAVLNAMADCTAPPAGLVAWWAAEGNTTDKAGTNNGALQGGATFATGEVGQAFGFNGNGSVFVADAPALRFTNAMTIEAWIYPTSWGGTAREIVSKWFGGANRLSYTTSIDPSGLAYLLVSSDGFTTTLGVDYNLVYTANTIPLNQWSHFAATYDGAYLNIYLNGVLENQVAWTQGIFPGTAPLVIGEALDQSAFDGLIDELSLYNRALSDAEIQEIYNAGSGGKCGLPPQILVQPQSQTVFPGATVTFSSAANGTGPLAYQWLFDGHSIAGATNSILTLMDVQISQAGVYSMQVTNAYGATNTSDAILTVNQTPPCLASPSGIVSRWAADADALDQAGTNNGTLRGVTFDSGVVNQAFDFDGSSGSVLVPDSPSLRFTNAMTIEAWINPRTSGSYHEIISKWFGVANQLSYTATIEPPGTAYFLVSSDGKTTTSNVNYIVLRSVNTVPLNQWTHFAVTYDGVSIKIYLNGALENQAAWNKGIFPGTSPLLIGAAYNQSLFNGLIDEPTLYNRALSADEIQAIYNSPVSGKCGLPPAILAQPKNQAATPTTNITFNVAAGGKRPLNYQWLFNGTNLLGATNASLTLTNVQGSNGGSYSVQVTNTVGSVTSSIAVLKVKVVSAFGNGLPFTNSQNSFGGPVTVSLQSFFTNGLIFFTLDGSAPTFASTLYTAPFVLSHDAVLRALAYSADFFQSGELDPTTILIVPVYSLVTFTSGGGSIALNPPGGSYLSNSTASVTATPAAGWIFLQWLGELAGTNPVASVTMNANRRVQAVFGTTLSTTAAGNGSVALYPPGGMYPYGTTVVLTAIPQAGSYFGLWGNAASGTANPLYFTVTNANPTVSALFAGLSGGQVSLVAAPNGRGKVTVNPRANAYSLGAGVILSATPDAGQSFLGWTGDATGLSNPLSVTLDASKVIVANFTKKPILTPNVSPGGVLDQGFRFTLDGEYGAAYQIQSSSNLAGWLPLATLTSSYGRQQVADTAATNAPRLFYRAVQVP
jgi:hypothetical protein